MTIPSADLARSAAGKTGGRRLPVADGVALAATALFLVAVLALALPALQSGRSIGPTLLLLTGVAGAAYATLQVTLVYLASPPAMRSRIMGVLTVCIGTAPLGFLGLGWLADRVGAPGATAIIGGLGLAVLLALAPLLRKI